MVTSALQVSRALGLEDAQSSCISNIWLGRQVLTAQEAVSGALESESGFYSCPPIRKQEST